MEGACLCGAIDVVANDQSEVGVCHCATCRRWSGGPMFAVHCDDKVQFKGGTPKVFRSSDWAERGFCGECGTHLFYRLVASGVYILPAGLFQQHPFALTGQVFIDEKPGFYELANDTPKLTGQQLFEQFAENP